MYINSFMDSNRKYKHIFFDLDRTLWDFEQNMRETLVSLYERHNLSRYIPDSRTFQDTFNKHNDRLWSSYRRGEIRKDILRVKRFDLTLRDFGLNSMDLALVIGDEYVAEGPTRTALVPHAVEILEYLKPKYKLHIITNGFNETQFRKLRLCGIEGYFDCVVTSEMSGAHKPQNRAFSHPLSLAGALRGESLMVGDDLQIDIIGAMQFGIDQVYFNPKSSPHSLSVTHEVRTLLELKEIL